MADRETILKKACLKSVDLCRQIAYHRAMRPYVGDLRRNYWIYTFNNFIDMAVLDWCHLFGNWDDDLHWRNVIGKDVGFKERVLADLDLNDGQWADYWECIKDYRNKDVAHIDIVSPATDVPDMELAIRSAATYYRWIMPELKQWPRYDPLQDELLEWFKEMQALADELVSQKIVPLLR